jgi:hypothetical protein
MDMVSKWVSTFITNLEPKSLQPLLLSTLKITKKITDDTWNRHPNGSMHCDIHTADGSSVGDFNYRTSTGQIGGIFLEEPYRLQALEQQMLVYMMKDMQASGATQIWEVIPKEHLSGQRMFYSSLWSFAYKDLHVHPSVTGGGYIMDIPDDLRTLTVTPGIGKYEIYQTLQSKFQALNRAGREHAGACT